LIALLQNKQLLRLFTLALLSVCFIGCKPKSDVDRTPAIDAKKKEIVFVTHNGPTTYYLNNDNQPAGIEYDLATQFVNDYYPDYKIRFVLVNSISEVIPSLLKGKAHIAAASLSVTHLREHLVLFSTPYQETQQQLIFNNEINKEPDNITDIIGKTLAVPEGTSYEEHLAVLQKKNITRSNGKVSNAPILNH